MHLNQVLSEVAELVCMCRGKDLENTTPSKNLG